MTNSSKKWKNTLFKWPTFSKQIDVLHRQRTRFHQLDYIKKLTIQHSDGTFIRDPLTDIIRIAPFKMLEEIHLINMHLTDIAVLLSWLKHIKIIHCENIHVPRGRINFSIFSRLERLESLHLRFAKPCPFGPAFFTPLRDQIGTIYQKGLARSLKHLSISNMYDPEEVLNNSISLNAEELFFNQPTEQLERHFSCWAQFDEHLVQKYKMFKSLSNLKSLTLGRVSSFTARVWRECFIPCSRNLEYLSMDNWEGAKKRETPQGLLARYRRELNRPEEVMPLYDVDAALSEFIASLKNIKKIELNCFYCEDGIINGLAKLKRPYVITCENNLEVKDINEFRHTTLFNVRIEFSELKE